MKSSLEGIQQGHLKHNKYNRKNFIIFPIVFLVISYLLLVLAFFPVGKMVSNTLELFFLDQNPQGSKNLYNGASQKSAGIIPLSKIQFPTAGDCYGKIQIDDTEVNAKLYYGDSDKELRNGIGTYLGGFIPGYGKTTLLAGHNHTFLHTLGRAKVGGKIHIVTNYGEYVYQITSNRVFDAKDTTAYDLSRKEENLILYTCYPFQQIGLTPKRYFVYAKYVSGPMLDVNA